ncbi:MAG TPA: hypothetical protein VFU02_06670 [Polyangiaceae bacterium]|nr:hypothetical protein [Polyangiaceae bacterium]
MTTSPHRLGTHISDLPVVTPLGPGVSRASSVSSVASTRGPTQTRVQFLDDVRFRDEEAKSGVLVACETSHPGGMIAPLVRGLTDLKLEVHQVESKLSDGVRSERLWVSAPDGEPLSQRRQGLLRTAVFQALESVTDPEDANELTA